MEDLIRSGDTQRLLLDIAEGVDAHVCGVFALIAAGEEGLDLAAELTDAPAGALVTF